MSKPPTPAWSLFHLRLLKKKFVYIYYLLMGAACHLLIFLDVFPAIALNKRYALCGVLSSVFFLIM